MIGNMKIKTIFFLLVIGVMILSACTPARPEQTSKGEVALPPAIANYNAQMAPKDIAQEDIASGNVRKATFAIDGMTCPSCALGVEYQWRQLEGVYDAQINYPAGSGFAVYDASKLTAEEIAELSTIYPARVTADESYTQ